MDNMQFSQPEKAKIKWYYNAWFVLFMLIFVLGPLGLPLVFKSPAFNRPVKILLTLAMLIYTFFLIGSTIELFNLLMGIMNQQMAGPN